MDERMTELWLWLKEKRGRQSELARYLGITPQSISCWRRVPAERVRDVAIFTRKPRSHWRPDLYERRRA